MDGQTSFISRRPLGVYSKCVQGVTTECPTAVARVGWESPPVDLPELALCFTGRRGAVPGAAGSCPGPSTRQGIYSFGFLTADLNGGPIYFDLP